MDQRRPGEAHEGAAEAAPAEVEAFRRLADLLDTRFRVPGLGLHVGLDGLIGLIPGVGDAVTGGLGLFALATAHRLKLPFTARAKMVWNIGVDMVLGAVPLVGDLFDFAFHAHAKNYRIIAKHLERRADKDVHRAQD